MDNREKSEIVEIVTEVGQALIMLGQALKNFAEKLNSATKETK
jgi:hypothetical protein